MLHLIYLIIGDLRSPRSQRVFVIGCAANRSCPRQTGGDPTAECSGSHLQLLGQPRGSHGGFQKPEDADAWASYLRDVASLPAFVAKPTNDFHCSSKSEASSEVTPEEAPLDEAPKDYLENAPEAEAGQDSASVDAAAAQSAEAEPVDDKTVDKAASADSDEPAQHAETRDSADSDESETADSKQTADQPSAMAETDKPDDTAATEAASDKKN